MNNLDFSEDKKITISFSNLNEIKFRVDDFDEEELRKIVSQFNNGNLMRFRNIFLEGEWVDQQLKNIDKIWQEINKPTIPQYVADWYEKNKNNLDYNIWNYVYEWEEQEEDEFKNWFNHSNKAFQTLVNMHQFGYEIEKEKKFLVKMKGLGHEFRVLKYNVFYNDWFTGSDRGDSEFRLHHTRKELEDAGFGWVFDCPGIEIEEVTE